MFEVILCSSLPTQFLIASVLAAIGIAPRIGDQLSLTFVFVLSVTDTAVLIALMVAITRAHGDSPWLLWRGRAPLISEIVVGLMLVPVAVFMVAFLMGLIRTLAPELHNVPENPLEALATEARAEPLLFAIVAIVAGGIREELQRAFLLQRFERHLGGATAGVIVLSTSRSVLDTRYKDGTLRSRPGRLVRSGQSSTSSGAAASRRWSVTRASIRSR